MTTNDQNNQSGDNAENGVTVTGVAKAVATRQKPAYILAREAAEEEEEAREQAKKRAAFTAAADPQDNDDDNAGRPGFSAAPAAGLPNPNQSLSDSFTPDLSGAGWITCSDGKRVRDDGTSIYAPGVALSPGQAEMILQLSMQKGWTEIYAFKGGSLSLNATQLLSQMIAARALPLHCCCDHKRAGSFNQRLSETEEIMCRLQRQRHEASKTPAEPSPA